MARDPDKVVRDVRQGLVSPDAAKAHYGVAVSADGTLDRAATMALRNRSPKGEAA